MSMIAPLFLASAIAMQNPAQPANDIQQSRNAVKALAKATYKELKIDDNIVRIEKRYVTKPMRKYGVWIVTIVKIQQEKRISYEWTF